MKIQFFKGGPDFRDWLERNHTSSTELTVGFFKKDSGKGGLTYAEALDEALCFGWIDGVRKGLDAFTYSIRFSPRRPRSIWSLINLRHVERLEKAGRMMAAGRQIHAARDPKRSGIYSFENRPQELNPADEKRFRKERAAWKFFQQQPPGYRRVAIWWVVSAKREETRQRRLGRLIAVSQNGQRLELLVSKKTKP